MSLFTYRFLCFRSDMEAYWLQCSENEKFGSEVRTTESSSLHSDQRMKTTAMHASVGGAYGLRLRAFHSVQLHQWRLLESWAWVNLGVGCWLPPSLFFCLTPFCLSHLLLFSLSAADFGFARYVVDKETKQRQLSETYCGSAAYAAPEVSVQSLSRSNVRCCCVKHVVLRV